MPHFSVRPEKYFRRENRGARCRSPGLDLRHNLAVRYIGQKAWGVLLGKVLFAALLITSDDSLPGGSDASWRRRALPTPPYCGSPVVRFECAPLPKGAEGGCPGPPDGGDVMYPEHCRITRPGCYAIHSLPSPPRPQDCYCIKHDDVIGPPGTPKTIWLWGCPM